MGHVNETSNSVTRCSHLDKHSLVNGGRKKGELRGVRKPEDRATKKNRGRGGEKGKNE